MSTSINKTVLSEQDDQEDSNIQNSAISTNVDDIKDIKLSEVPEEERISLDENTHFKFSCSVENDKLFLLLKPIGEYAPFTYEKKLTWKKIQKIHQIFESCEGDLEKVKKHFDTLFQKKNIKLKKENDESILLQVTVGNISFDVELDVEVTRILTNHKDEALMKLYQIEKNEIKLIKEIKKYLENQNDNREINELKKILSKE